jgi:hypothetical protein
MSADGSTLPDGRSLPVALEMVGTAANGEEAPDLVARQCPI